MDIGRYLQVIYVFAKRIYVLAKFFPTERQKTEYEIFQRHSFKSKCKSKMPIFFRKL